MNRFISKLASICFPFRDFFKKDAVWNMTGHLEKSFNKKNEKVKKVTEITYFKRLDQRRIICDAGKKRFGSAIATK